MSGEPYDLLDGNARLGLFEDAAFSILTYLTDVLQSSKAI
jgi:hypothetical protein